MELFAYNAIHDDKLVVLRRKKR